VAGSAVAVIVAAELMENSWLRADILGYQDASLLLEATEKQDVIVEG
jgi:hypothetical protein